MVYTNLIFTSKEIDRKSEATRIATNIIESMNGIFYDELEDELDSLSTSFVTKVAEENISTYTIAKNQGEPELLGVTIPNGYQTTITVENIYDSAEDTYDLVKKVTVKLEFLMNENNETVELSKVFQREAVRECNTPNFGAEYLQNLGINDENYIFWYDNAGVSNEDYIICPIQYNNSSESYELVSEDIIKSKKIWYSYSNKQWARVLILDSNEYTSTIDQNNNTVQDEAYLTGANSYLWIPRFNIATNDKIYFQYKNTSNAILNSYYDTTPNLINYYIDSENTINWSNGYNISFGQLLGKWVPYSEIDVAGKEAYWLNRPTLGIGPLKSY